ncbi:hypothetical protein BGZ65_002049 [Modicella reniformis]|uniref:Cation efflux protein n=1 Tax=Modicella reniformis TaxID=1440133 RepID=A0A9P6MJ16_9FUNG|nr:hypothetical protein BGZ65_002049 [Modicella reniformis]
MFLAEIIVGYTTGSLALIADAFHMLSDILSQVIALYAIRLAAKTKWRPTLTYGWQRAELLGALYNGVFLLALCFSILLDAVERFFKPADIENPKLVLIVGGIGLVCNLFGLVLFHDHTGIGHGHGHSHSHSHSKAARSEISDKQNATEDKAWSLTLTDANEQEGPDPENLRISPLKETNLQNLQQTALEIQRQLENEEIHAKAEAIENGGNPHPDAAIVNLNGVDHDDQVDRDNTRSHGDEGKGPSGEDLNMRGIFLHVLGDALGSVGVIFSALFIWRTDFSWRYYMDPIVSLCITAIIVRSAIPLVRSASFILMQAVPVGVEIDEIRKEIKAIPDVISIHDLHIWQLTNTKMVASLHVRVVDQEVFEKVSRAVKTIMHHAGVHSTTIQPEFPDLSQVAKAKNVSREEESQTLLSAGELSGRATSFGAQGDESLLNGSEGISSSSKPGVDRAESDTVTGAGGHLVQAAVDEPNCTFLCVDGEQSCDVGSCCTTPVRR